MNQSGYLFLSSAKYMVAADADSRGYLDPGQYVHGTVPRRPLRYQACASSATQLQVPSACLRVQTTSPLESCLSHQACMPCLLCKLMNGPSEIVVVPFYSLADRSFV
jgi:hypothetical protein